MIGLHLLKRKPPRVVVFLDGGLIEEVVTSREMEILVIDQDLDFSDEDDVKKMKNVHGVEVEVVPSRPFITVSERSANSWIDQYREVEQDAIQVSDP